jgi:zinc protease
MPVTTLKQASFAVSILTALAASPAAQASGPEISHFTFENGLELVVIPDHRAPVVTHMIWYRVGSADEQPGKSGLAHFLEHLMFKGTATHPMGEFSQIVANMGGQENAFTSNDYTGYFQRVPREHLARVMEFEADRMEGLVLTDAAVLPERDVVLEELNQRVGNSPTAQLTEEMEAALFLNSPYGRPVIGWKPEVEKLNRGDALAFYRRFYTPNNAVVVIAGDVTAAAVKDLADGLYAKIPRRSELGPRLRPQEPQQRSVRSLTLADPRVEQPLMQRYYLVPSRSTAKRGESEALEVLAHVLGGGSSSRMYQTLIVQQPLAVDVGAFYQGAAVDPTRFGMYGSPRPGVDFARLEQAMDAVLAELTEKEVAADELERSKTRLIANAVYAQDNQAQLARWYGSALTTGSAVEDVKSWPERIRAVTASDVREAARTWFNKRHSVTGYLVKDAAPREEKRS